jgi:hypothetical protein
LHPSRLPVIRLLGPDAGPAATGQPLDLRPTVPLAGVIRRCHLPRFLLTGGEGESNVEGAFGDVNPQRWLVFASHSQFSRFPGRRGPPGTAGMPAGLVPTLRPHGTPGLFARAPGPNRHAASGVGPNPPRAGVSRARWPDGRATGSLTAALCRRRAEPMNHRGVAVACAGRRESDLRP